MREQFDESPFRNVRDGRPWHFQEQQADPALRDRSIMVTVLALGLLIVATVVAPFAFQLLPMLSYLLIFGISSPAYQDVFLLSVGLLVGTLAPFALPLVMAIGLFRMASWSRKGTIIALPITLTLGGGVVGLFYWTRSYVTLGDTIRLNDTDITVPLGWYALAMIPLTAVLLFGLTRPQVAEEMEEEASGQ